MPKPIYQAGIYSIYCIANEKQYIGSSVNIKRRFREHRSKLSRNIHTCRHLQNAWNKYGAESFVFNVVEHIIEPLVTAKQLMDVEQVWLDAYWAQGNLFNKIG